MEASSNAHEKRRGSEQDKPTHRPEEFRQVDHLPPEVLREIFSYLSFTDRKNIRLVCCSFYEACDRNEYVRIRNANQWEEFRNCRLNHMNVTIDFIEGKWNPVVWKEVGARIRSLHMNTCTPGHGSAPILEIGLENVIMFCENLQTLRVSLRNGNAQRFCSPSVLEEMNVVRNKLETLIIQRQKFTGNSGYRLDKWMKLFTALLRIFPDVRHYTSGWQNDNSSTQCFSCSCSVKPEFTNQSELSYALALMLSGGQADWSRALAILSKLRFSAISIIGSSHEHYLLRMALSKFFEKQKALVSGETKQGSRVRFSASEEKEFERSVTQRINSHWPHTHLVRAGLLQYGVTCRSRIDLSDLNSELSNSDEALLDINTRLYDAFVSSALSTSVTWKHEPGATDIYPREILKRHESIEHLILTLDVSDKMLQTIFQFLTRLVSLEVRLGQHNTRYGLTGTSDCSSVKGYSIKRLQQLKSLTITSDRFSFDDSIFDEFDFPRLSYLNALNPKELATLRNLILRLPALEDVAFHTQEVSSFLDVVCSGREKPIFISFRDVRESFSAADLNNFFDSYPSLDGLCINQGIYYRE